MRVLNFIERTIV